jgi:cysteine desulfurase
VLGSLAGRRRAGNVLLHSAVEHSSVLKAAEWHQAHGGAVRVAGVDAVGRIDLDEFVALAADPGVGTAVLQAANHEVGTRQPVAEAAHRLAEFGVPLVVDASQELVYGRAPAEAPIFTADARLWGGPAGVGLLVVRQGTRWRPPFPVDEAESGRAAGAPNVPAIVAAAASLRATRVDRLAEAVGGEPEFTRIRARKRDVADIQRRRSGRSIGDRDTLGTTLGADMDRTEGETGCVE